MYKSILTGIIVFIAILLALVIYEKLIRTEVEPVKDTSADLMGEISNIDMNATNRQNKTIEDISSGDRGKYE